MKMLSKSQGFSLIEVIIIVVIIGAAFSGLSVVLSNTTTQNMNLDLETQAIFLAREKMSEMKAKKFADIASVGLTNFGGDFARYDYQVTVGYVDAADLNTTVAGPTDYKRIQVAVTGTAMPGSINLYDMRTDTE